MLSTSFKSPTTLARAVLAVLAATLLMGACAAERPGEGAEASEGASEAVAAEGASEEAMTATAGDTATEGGDTASAEGSIMFGGIADGDTVASPVSVTFEAEGFTIEEAGAVTDGAGHMHVMIDTACVTPGEVIPSDDSHVHFGDGSTSAELELEPGEHTLCLQAGDGEHTALDLTDEITVIAE